MPHTEEKLNHIKMKMITASSSAAAASPSAQIQTNCINSNNHHHNHQQQINNNNNNNNNIHNGSSNGCSSKTKACSNSSNAMSFTAANSYNSNGHTTTTTTTTTAATSTSITTNRDFNNSNSTSFCGNTCSSSSSSTNTLSSNSSCWPAAASSAPSSSFTSTNLFQLLAIVLLTLLCYYNATQCALVFDDISAIRDNKDLRPLTPLKNIFLNDFWGTPMRKEHSHKSYRPLTVLTFRFNYMLHQLEPYGYHALNVILHIVVCLLWKRVSRLLVLQCTQNLQLAQKLSFLSALLFAIHPIHTEAVTGVVGRAELLSSIFFLLAFLAYSQAVSSSNSSNISRNSKNNGFTNAAVQRKLCQQLNNNVNKTQWPMLCINFSASLLASMLCKEQGITIAGICVTYELFVIQNIHPLQLCHSLLNLFEEKPTTLNQNASSLSSSPTNKPNNWHRHHATAINWSSNLLKRLIFLIVITLCLLIGRVYVMGSQLPVFTRFDNPASASESPTRQLTYSYLIYLNIWLLLFPCDLCCDWTMGTVPLIEGFADVRNVATLATFGFLAAFIVKACLSKNVKHTRMLIMCLAWIVLPFLPATNLFFPVGFVVAERILYMPSMGFCLLIAYGYELLKQKMQDYEAVPKMFGEFALKSMLILLMLTHSLKTYQRNKDWQTEYSLFMSGLHVNDRNAKLFNNVGHALENEQRYNEALQYFQQAVAIQDDDIGAHINVGRTYNNLKLYHEAEQAYLKAKSLFPRIKPGESYQARIAPNHLNVFINLANLIARNQTRLEEADFLYRQAISMRADYVQAYINRGDILMKLNRTTQAQEVYEKALLYDSENADIYYNLGVVFLEQGKSAQANVYFNKALELYPEHEQALLNSAILLQEMGNPEARQISRERLHRVLAKTGDNEKVFFNLGMLAMDETDFEAAEQFFKRAIHLKADFRSALFNLALLLADANRPLDAVPFLNQLIRHHPDHIKGLILLGDIYINHMKDLDAAEQCYRSILKYEPHNIQGLHNLCVVFVERKHLARAKDCLKYAYGLAPTEDYILRHLQIVEQRLQKLNQLPDTSPEKQLALAEFQEKEFAFASSSFDQQQKQLVSSSTQSEATLSSSTSSSSRSTKSSKAATSKPVNHS